MLPMVTWTIILAMVWFMAYDAVKGGGVWRFVGIAAIAVFTAELWQATPMLYGAIIAESAHLPVPVLRWHTGLLVIAILWRGNRMTKMRRREPKGMVEQ